MQSESAKHTGIAAEASRLGFFAHYPRFFETSGTDTRGQRLASRHAALIEANHDKIVGKRILDLASHDGRWSFAALKAGAAHVCGIEARAYLVEHAERNMQAYGMTAERYQFLVGDCLEMLRGMPSGKVDTVFCFGFLYHTLSHFELIKQIHRLSPQYLLIDSLLVDSDKALVQLAFDDPNREGAAIATSDEDDKSLVGIPTKRALELLLRHFGFWVDYYDWHTQVQDDWTGVEDYRKGRRFTLTATAGHTQVRTHQAPEVPAPMPTSHTTRVHSKHLLGQIPAVIIDGRIVSLLEVLQHAYTRRQCEFLDRAIDHYLIEGAARRDGIEVLPEERERLRAQFFDSACQGDANGQQSWLRAGDLSEEALNEQLEGILRFGKLKGRIADAWVTPVFERHREQFAAVSLAQIVVPHQSAAKRLMSRLQRGADFAQLMHAHSEDQAGGSSGGFLGRLFYADLPPNIATRVREAAEGQILGPFPCGDGWTLYRVERHWPPILNAVTRTRIHHAIFNSWLACKRQRVELRIPLWENL